ncbi:MAG: YchJ family metal-binding protein [Pseudomonadota bacterium]
MTCPCGSGSDYTVCCGIFHQGQAYPETAESLMRSRYCAFTKEKIEYLRQTTWPGRQKHFDEAGYRDRAANSIWLGLTIHEAQEGLQGHTRGTVVFTAKSMVNGNLHEQREESLFKKKNDRWYYVKPLS